MDWQKHLAAGQTVARRGSRVGHLRGRFRFSLLSEERKPKDFQHSVRLTKSCNIPSSQECNEVEPVPAVEGCREKRVLYLTGCKCSINSFQMMMLFFICVCVQCVWGQLFCVSGRGFALQWHGLKNRCVVTLFYSKKDFTISEQWYFDNAAKWSVWKWLQLSVALFVFFFPHLSKQVCRHFFK